jgi:hypothetical protein
MILFALFFWSFKNFLWFALNIAQLSAKNHESRADERDKQERREERRERVEGGGERRGGRG